MKKKTWFHSHQGHGALADMHCGWQATPYTYIYVQIPGDLRLAKHSKRYSELVCIIIVGGEAFLRPLQPLLFLFMDLGNISLMSDGFSHTYDASDDPMQRR